MKKIIILMLTVFLIPMNVFGISAASYVVMDQNSNTILCGNNIHDEKLIASITKIMTTRR